MNVMRVLVIYVPVIHEGYLRLFRKYANDVDCAYIVGAELVDEHRFLEREIRALEPSVVQGLVASLNLFKYVRLLDEQSARALDSASVEAVTADEQISKRIASAYFPKAVLKIEPIFLRWDEANVRSDKEPTDARVSSDVFDLEMMARANALSTKSSDWWRRVGAVLVKDGKVILESFNSHVPSEHAPYAHGDPRDVVQAGTSPEISTVLHAEQRLIVEAAKQGISLQGASIYTTVFPCAMCAKMIAYSGIGKCFYASGHASLDGEAVMRANGVELIKVIRSET